MRSSVLLFFIAVTVFQHGCGACAEDQLMEASSPAKKYAAVAFRRGCGATSGFFYHVNIRPSTAIFSSDARGIIEEGQVFLTREGKISIQWKDNAMLQITCDGCPKDPKPKMETSWSGINISYDLR
jgi:hypothetical protein